MCFFRKSDLFFVWISFWVLVGLSSLFLEFVESSPQCSHPNPNMANMEQQMHQMFIHLGFSQAIATRIVDDHSIMTLTDLLRLNPMLMTTMESTLKFLISTVLTPIRMMRMLAPR